MSPRLVGTREQRLATASMRFFLPLPTNDERILSAGLRSSSSFVLLGKFKPIFAKKDTERQVQI
jgi:hypothetical protein